jgi:hypothetical protein
MTSTDIPVSENDGRELNGSTNHEIPTKEEASGDTLAIEYFTGFKLWLILIALLLAMFLVALDMVSSLSTNDESHAQLFYRVLSPRLFQKSRMIFKA